MDRNAGLPGEPLHGLHEREAFGLHDELEDVAVRTRGEAVVEPLLVIDEEGRGLLHLERRQAAELATGLLQRHLAADHMAEIGRAHV